VAWPQTEERIIFHFQPKTFFPSRCGVEKAVTSSKQAFRQGKIHSFCGRKKVLFQPGLPDFSLRNIPKLGKNTKRPHYIPNGRIIYQMLKKHS
jgi:hypothetical protein